VYVLGFAQIANFQGHGALVSIYEAVRQQCEQRGWDGVDCVIIGGDFQVRFIEWKESAHGQRQFEMQVTCTQ